VQTDHGKGQRSVHLLFASPLGLLPKASAAAPKTTARIVDAI
jgi:hypothetical protein